jgi:hypothetical protein
MKLYRIIILTIALCAGMTPSHAQDFSQSMMQLNMAFDNARFTNFQNDLTWSGFRQLGPTPQYAVSDDEEEEEESEYAASRNAAPQRSGYSNPAALIYTPNSARSTANKNNYLARVRRNSPATAAQIEQMFAQTNYLGAVHNKMRELGLNPNNLAHCYTIHWISVWQAANQDNSDPSPQTVQAVAKQAESTIAGVQSLATYTDAQKQEYSDFLLVQAMIVGGNSDYYLSQGNRTEAANFVIQARQHAREAGLLIEGLTLTEKGFRPVG